MKRIPFLGLFMLVFFLISCQHFDFNKNESATSDNKDSKDPKDNKNEKMSFKKDELKSKDLKSKDTPSLEGEPLLLFSENNILPNNSNRQYKRMTRQRLEEEAEINDQAGSMWVMDGQGAYLFAQNKMRKEGDLLNVKIEGGALKQIETKVSVIKKLLKQLEEEEIRQQELKEQQLLLQQAQMKKDQDKINGLSSNAAAAPASPSGGAANDITKTELAKKDRSPASGEKKEKEDPVTLDLIPTKIIEKLADGTYRIRGQSPFMIDKREYKVLVTGIIRAEDYNDDNVSSNKIIDPQYDVISVRRRIQ